VDRLPPPLLGFNNNVQHNGRTFHIQTEDSGFKYCRVVTHLFADGGRILQTRRTDYSSHTGEPDLIDRVRHLMKTQHRSMFTALRGGEFDDVIRSTFEGPTQAELDAASSPMSQRAQLHPEQSPPLTLRSREPSKAPEPKTDPPPGKRPSSRPKRSSPSQPLTQGAEVYAMPPPPALAEPSAAMSLLLTPPKPRPSMASNDSTRRQPNGGSIFGDNAASEQSLDDVILSYLEDDTVDPAGRT